MSTLLVTIRDIEEQRQTEQELTLDGVRVRVVARYSGLQDRWFASVYALDGSLLVGSIACVPGVDLLRPFKYLAIPQGELFVSSVGREPPTFDTIDTAARVLYREVAT